MTCIRCGGQMYRVVNQDLSSKATCGKCCQWVDCAQCQKCGDLKCVGCYNIAIRSLKIPPKAQDPIIPHEEDPS